MTVPDALVRPRRALRPVGTLLCLLLLVCGCAGSVPQVSAAAPVPTAVPTTGALPSEARPTRLHIPTIDVDSGLVDLGLTSDGAMEVPADGSTAGWYTDSPAPGELGPAVLAAHVDWEGDKGVFYDLRQLEPGDEITVDRSDGGPARFAVRRVEQYPKDRFPTAEVYGDVDGPQLRLITCGGEFDDDARSYRDNIVVYAELTSS